MKLLLQNDLLKIPAVISLGGWRATNREWHSLCSEATSSLEGGNLHLAKHCPQIYYSHNEPQRQHTKRALCL